jgi:Tfp pilus assembly protein FimT
VAFGLPKFKFFFSKLEISRSLRMVTSAISTARYNAIKNNRAVKLCVENNQILLKEKINKNWQTFIRFKNKNREVKITANAWPIFSPLGSISPLCSFQVNNRHLFYKITLSMAGRIKVTKEK